MAHVGNIKVSMDDEAIAALNAHTKAMQAFCEAVKEMQKLVEVLDTALKVVQEKRKDVWID